MKELYIKIKENSDLPKVILSYSYKDFNDVIHIEPLVIDFNDNDEKNIKIFETIKEKHGDEFMFFNQSEEGLTFWKKHQLTWANLLYKKQNN